MATEVSNDLSEQSTTSRPAILKLPPELICRVSTFLDKEMLPAIRLTCKALEDATFDRFVEAHFAHIYCWVFTPTAFHRLKDILQNSPTLQTRIRRVTLTDNPYDDQPLSALHVVRTSNEHDDDWGRYYMSYNLHKNNNLGTGHVLMHRVLRDLKDLPQDVSVNVDLTNLNHACCSYELRKRTFQSVLFSIALSRTLISLLTIDDKSLKDVEDILAHNKDDFMASMSTITSLTCISDFWLPTGTPVKAVLVDILRSITKLRHLTFEINRPSNTEEYAGRCFNMLQMPQEIWLAANFSNLVSLILRHVVIDMTQHELEHILAQCRSSLTHLTLSRVAFLAGDEEWKRVSEMLLAMSGLIFVELQMVHPREDPVSFWGADVETLSGGNPPGIRLEGRNNVVRGLQELSDLGPAFFEQLR